MATTYAGGTTEQGSYNADDGIVIGASATEKVGLYGVTPIVQRTAAILTSAVDTASSADVTTALKAAVIDIMNTLAAVGLWKAS
jgi:hypothetical protein